MKSAANSLDRRRLLRLTGAGALAVGAGLPRPADHDHGTADGGRDIRGMV